MRSAGDGGPGWCLMKGKEVITFWKYTKSRANIMTSDKMWVITEIEQSATFWKWTTGKRVVISWNERDPEGDGGLRR